MGYIATFDIGTTAVKGLMVSETGKSIMEKSITLETVFVDDHKEQRPLDWYSAFCKISNAFFQEGFLPDEVHGIVMSGQMQDLIPVSRELSPVCNAILYSDGRAEAQAQEIAACIGMDVIEESTGNHFDGSLPFPKLMWLKQNKPLLYDAAEKILISSKDYVVARLTGKFATDVTSASTAGLMDIHNKCWNRQWMELMGMDADKLPVIYYAEEQVGLVSKEASLESGFAAGIPVYAGTGDAGATTLASGIAVEGEFNINLGTSGWIACVSKDTMKKPGVFNLAAMQKNLYINVVPFLNAANVHQWISGIFAADSATANKYELIDQLLKQSKAGSNGVMFFTVSCRRTLPCYGYQSKRKLCRNRSGNDQGGSGKKCLGGCCIFYPAGIGEYWANATEDLINRRRGTSKSMVSDSCRCFGTSHFCLW